MSTKHVPFGAKPTAVKAEPRYADTWVQSRDDGPMKRLTIDVPVELHARVKSQCALRGLKMADEVRALLEQRFPKG